MSMSLVSLCLLQGIPFDLEVTEKAANSFTVKLTKRAKSACDASLSGYGDCCNSAIKKVEFAINRESLHCEQWIDKSGLVCGS